IIAEAVLADETAGTLAIVGLRQITGRSLSLSAAIPVDTDIDLSGVTPHGSLFSTAKDPGLQASGITVGGWTYVPYHPRSRGSWTAPF
ncbi:MAG TPA: hypothetical protein VGM23_13740, partial [Armatimonadota bacterium]